MIKMAYSASSTTKISNSRPSINYRLLGINKASQSSMSRHLFFLARYQRLPAPKLSQSVAPDRMQANSRAPRTWTIQLTRKVQAARPETALLQKVLEVIVPLLKSSPMLQSLCANKISWMIGVSLQSSPLSFWLITLSVVLSKTQERCKLLSCMSPFRLVSSQREE